MKQIPIGTHHDGFRVTQINCVDLCIAGMADIYSHNNYYYYCFFYAIQYNWGELYGNVLRNDSEQILKNLGLCLKKYTLDSSSEFISFIKESVDQNKPILWVTNYYKLFYSTGYLNEKKASSHGTIINGYCPDKKVIAIKETNLGEIVEFSRIVGADSLISFRFKENYIRDIWNELNEYYKETNSPYYNVVFRVEKDEKIPIVTFDQAIHKLISQDVTLPIMNNDRLIHMIRNFNKKRTSYNENFFSWLRTYLVGSFAAFFRCIATEFKDAASCPEMTEMNRFKEQYLLSRTKIISILHANMLRGKDIDKSQEEKMITEIEVNNELLKNKIKDVYDTFKRIIEAKQNKTNLVNHILDAKIWADSESYHCVASRVRDGKWTSWENDMWYSNDLEKEHWLQMDCTTPRQISRFVIRHFPHKGYITSDFEIQGSQDGDNWDTLFDIQGNVEEVTIHENVSCTYRFYKLYIKKPCENDFYARIFEFEAWGEP